MCESGYSRQDYVHGNDADRKDPQFTMADFDDYINRVVRGRTEYKNPPLLCELMLVQAVAMLKAQSAT